jgi:hypothetical protein
MATHSLQQLGSQSRHHTLLTATVCGTSACSSRRSWMRTGSVYVADTVIAPVGTLSATPST